MRFPSVDWSAVGYNALAVLVVLWLAGLGWLAVAIFRFNRADRRRAKRRERFLRAEINRGHRELAAFLAHPSQQKPS